MKPQRSVLALLAGLFFSSLPAGAQSVSVSIGDVNLATGTVEVLFSNTVAVAGFQFDVSGVTIDGVCCGATDSAGFDMNWNAENGRVLCFGFGVSIPPGPERVLLELAVHCDEGECDNSSAICLSAPVFSDLSANSIPTSVGSCQGFYSTFCYGDGSSTVCPCGNNGSAGEGCSNSGGSGAILSAMGSNDVVQDDITFHVAQGPPSVPGILFTGTVQASGGSGFVFGDGLLCATGMIQRMQVKFLDGAGAATWGPALQTQGGWGPGDTRHVQAWYRDVTGPCSSGFNTSHALTINFLP